MFEKFLQNIFQRKNIDKNISAEKNTENPLSNIVGGQRVSKPQSNYTFSSLLNEYSTVYPDFDTKFIEIIEKLVQTSPDFRLATVNLISLANTPFDVFIEHKNIKDSDTILADLKKKEKKWYNYTGGINALRNDLLMQLCINGALSAEIVPNKELNGVSKIILVPPKNIRFKYNSILDEYKPVQINTGNAFEIYLNTTTYKYYTLQRIGEAPYAVIPYLASLDNVVIEKDMINNLREITKNFGLLGFLEVLITAPKQKTLKNGYQNTNGKDETETEYLRRLQSHIDAADVQMKKGLSNGYLIGVEGQHKFDMKSTTANVSGADSLVRINTEFKHAGLQQSPFLLGRNYSTTETLGNVILTIFTSQIQNYQQVVDTFLSDVYKLELELNGYENVIITVESKKPLTNDEYKDQQAFSLKIDNYEKLYKNGVISQEEKARSLGYSKADQKIPRQDVKIDSKQAQTSQNSIENKFSKYVPFFYDNESKHKQTANFAKGDKVLNSYIDEYISETTDNYDEAVNSVLNQIANDLKSVTTIFTIVELQDKIISTLLTTWESAFINSQIAISKKNIESAYSVFRNDKSIFPDANNIPESVFNQMDLRTIEYMKQNDYVYLGKFITEPQTKERITNFIKDTYLEKGYDLRSKKGIDLFIKEFGTVLDLQKWKIDQIISTTMSRMRFQSGLSYMNQAGVQYYERVSIADKLRCPYCQHLSGKKFSVKTSLNRVNESVTKDVEDISTINPFVSSVFKDIKYFETLNNVEIQENGVESVPSHCHCRCSIIAIM